MRTVMLSEMTWQEAKDAAARNALLILPIGSTEQHGTHLPLGTDVYIPLGIAKILAEKVGAVIAPPITYGYYSRPKSGGGETFPGTTSLSAATFISLLRDITIGFIRTGFRRLLILNGHYENSALLPEGVEKGIHETGVKDVKVVILGWSDVLEKSVLDQIFPDGFPGWEIEHAAITETSLMQLLNTDLVRSDKMRDDKASRVVLYEIIPAPLDTISKTGSLWKSSPASKDKGKILADAVVEKLLHIIKTDLR